MLAYFKAIWVILRPFGFLTKWYSFPHFSMLYQEKSGFTEVIPSTYIPVKSGLNKHRFFEIMGG
jgi:hypothetical protein